jgi:hypothetical protein
VNDLESLIHARTAAEAVRQLNDATLGCRGYVWPSDVDAVIAELHLSVIRMEQALHQARRWLTRAHDAGAAGHDQNRDIDTAIADVTRFLTAATISVRRLGTDLDRVRSVTAHLTGLATLPEHGIRQPSEPAPAQEDR